MYSQIAGEKEVTCSTGAEVGDTIVCDPNELENRINLFLVRNFNRIYILLEYLYSG